MYRTYTSIPMLPQRWLRQATYSIDAMYRLLGFERGAKEGNCLSVIYSSDFTGSHERGLL